MSSEFLFTPDGVLANMPGPVGIDLYAVNCLTGRCNILVQLRYSQRGGCDCTGL